MKTTTSSFRQGKLLRLTVIVASLVAVLVISSLFWMLHLGHQFVTQDPPQINTAGHGIYLFTTKGIDKLDIQTHQVLWHYEHVLPDPLGMHMRLFDDTIYVLDTNGSLTAINTHNGKARWSLLLFHGSQDSLVSLLVSFWQYRGWLSIRGVYPPLPDHPIASPLYTIDTTNGKITHITQLLGGATGVTVIENVIYYETADGSRKDIVAERISDGKILWRTPGPQQTAGARDTDFVVSDGIVYVGEAYAGEAGGSIDREQILALDAHTGKRLWQYSGKFVAIRTLATAGGRVYLAVAELTATTTNDRIDALDERTGKPLWTRPIVGSLSSMVATSDTLYLSSGDAAQRALMALNGKDGTQRWQRLTNFDGLALVSLYLVNHVLYEAPYTKDLAHTMVYTVRARDGVPLWQIQLPLHEGVMVA